MEANLQRLPLSILPCIRSSLLGNGHTAIQFRLPMPSLAVSPSIILGMCRAGAHTLMGPIMSKSPIVTGQQGSHRCHQGSIIGGHTPMETPVILIQTLECTNPTE